MEVIARRRADHRTAGAVRDRRPPRRRPRRHVRRPDADRRDARLEGQRTASTTSSPRRGTGTARTSTATTIRRRPDAAGRASRAERRWREGRDADDDRRQESGAARRRRAPRPADGHRRSGTLSSSSPCITSSGRGAKRRAASTGSEPAQLPGPLVERRREAGRADRADLAGVLEESARLRGPVVEVGARAEQGGATHAWIVGGDARGDRAAGVACRRARSRSAVASAMRWSIAARRSSTHPCSEKSPSLVPQPRKLNVIAAQPSSLAIRSINSGNVTALWRASSGPIGKPWHRITPGQRPMAAGRARRGNGRG